MIPVGPQNLSASVSSFINGLVVIIFFFKAKCLKSGFRNLSLLPTCPSSEFRDRGTLKPRAALQRLRGPRPWSPWPPWYRWSPWPAPACVHWAFRRGPLSSHQATWACLHLSLCQPGVPRFREATESQTPAPAQGSGGQAWPWEARGPACCTHWGLLPAGLFPSPRGHAVSYQALGTCRPPFPPPVPARGRLSPLQVSRARAPLCSPRFVLQLLRCSERDTCL